MILLSADVVLADGKIIKANADENPDLFSPLRGGGGNFSIVSIDFSVQFASDRHAL